MENIKAYNIRLYEASVSYLAWVLTVCHLASLIKFLKIYPVSNSDATYRESMWDSNINILIICKHNPHAKTCD